MARGRRREGVVQAWVFLNADDPEAVSALGVARAHLPAGAGLAGLRRARVFELRGALPGREEVEDLLHRSTQFYNPHKERCIVRDDPEDPAPVAAGERIVLVWERGGERRAGAERWWLHETRRRIEVREGVAWLVRLEPGEPAARVEELADVTGRRRGLLCNPHAQEHRVSGADAPLPWWETPERGRQKEER